MTQNITPLQSVRIARHVTWVGFWWNALLGTLKIIAGVAGRSSALIADGIHSFSDFVSDVIVLVMVGIARKKPDSKHEYGHGKYETLATILLAAVLLVVAGGILVSGITQIVDFIHGEEISRPEPIALVICAASIIVKEWLYQYTRRAGVKIKSEAVVANAWHHRSDAFSSVATLAGVAGAIFLGDWGRICDPIAAIVVAVFITVVAVKMALPAISELLEIALSEEEKSEIYNAITSAPGVVTFHHLRSRRSGTNVIIDLHIKVNPDISVENAHHIATSVEDNLRAHFGRYETLTNIHIEPYHGETIRPDGSCE